MKDSSSLPEPTKQKLLLPAGLKPYYADDAAGIYIFNGDCRSILPHLPKVDLVLTDPPYGIGGPKGTKNKARNKTTYNTTMFEDSPEYVKEFLPLFFEFEKRGQRMILTPGAKMMFAYPEPKQVGVFYMPSGCGVGHWGWVNWQPIFFYGKDPRQGKTLDQTCKTLGPSDKNGHPCPKPFKQWLWLAGKGSMEGDTILDPFMGSGTTLRAAKDLGRQAIGIEIEEKYCAVAVNRLRQEVLPLF